MKKNYLVYKMIILLIFSAAVLFVFMMYMFLFQPIPSNYTINDEYTFSKSEPHFVDIKKQSVQEVESLLTPVKSGSDMGEWAGSIVMNAATLNFFQLGEQLDKLKPYFTEKGWNAFRTAIDPTLEVIIKKKLSSTAVLIGVPVPLMVGMYNGSYSWQFQMPVLISYESLSETVKQRQIVTVVIKRVPVSKENGMRGIAVDSFVSTG